MAAAPAAADFTAAVDYVRSKLGSPYVYGADGPNDFDCSGLTYAAFKSAGVSVPRTSEEQYSASKRITADQLQPGDLVFSEFGEDPGQSGPGHVAMYVGDGQVVQAPHTGEDVEVTPLSAFGAQAYGTFRSGVSTASGSGSSGGGFFTTLLGTVVGGPAGEAEGGSGLLSWPDQIVGAFADIDTAVAKAYQEAALFFQPSTYVRIGAGLAGAVFLTTGIVLLVKGARQS